LLGVILPTATSAGRRAGQGTAAKSPATEYHEDGPAADRLVPSALSDEAWQTPL
jgi:hypothetical protein